MESYNNHNNDKVQASFESALEDKNSGELLGSQIMGRAGNPPGKGPFIEFYLTFNGEIFLNATFKTYGCPVCIACSKAICKLVEGRNFEQTRQITKQDLIQEVGQIPRTKRHCLEYAVAGLCNAIEKMKVQ